MSDVRYFIIFYIITFIFYSLCYQNLNFCFIFDGFPCIL